MASSIVKGRKCVRGFKRLLMDSVRGRSWPTDCRVGVQAIQGLSYTTPILSFFGNPFMLSERCAQRPTAIGNPNAYPSCCNQQLARSARVPSAGPGSPAWEPPQVLGSEDWTRLQQPGRSRRFPDPHKTAPGWQRSGPVRAGKAAHPVGPHFAETGAHFGTAARTRAG